MVKVRGLLISVQMKRIKIQTHNESITLPVENTDVIDDAMRIISTDAQYSHQVVIEVMSGQITSIVKWDLGMDISNTD